MVACLGYFVMFVCLMSTCMAVTSVTPQKYILEDNCGSPISFSESMILVASNLRTEACKVVIQTNAANNKLLIQFTKFNFVDTCASTKLNIVDELGKTIAGPLCGSDLDKTVFKTQGNIAHFPYFSSNPSTSGKTMSAIITSFNTGIDGKCSSGEFQCDNKLCIAENLFCNGYNECSDFSDEKPGCGGNYISGSSLTTPAWAVVALAQLVLGSHL